jgi:putative sporulation protein YtaF
VAAMTGLTALLIALSCNLDNVGVGLSYGARGIRLPLVTNLYIALLTAAGTGLAMILGGQTFRFLTPESGAILGGAILVVMGIWVILQETLFKKSRQCPEPRKLPPGEDLGRKSVWQRLVCILEYPALADDDFSGHIDLREGTLLGLALMLNNLPNGVAAAMLKLPVPLTMLAVGILSVLTFWLGIGIGANIGSRWNGKWTWVASGALLMGIGTTEIILALPHGLYM